MFLSHFFQNLITSSYDRYISSYQVEVTSVCDQKLSSSCMNRFTETETKIHVCFTQCICHVDKNDNDLTMTSFCSRLNTYFSMAHGYTFVAA